MMSGDLMTHFRHHSPHHHTSHIAHHPSPMSALLQLSSVETFIGGSRILRGVDLEVNAGEVVALMGRNGVGKTTTLRSITGVLPVRSGSITFDGERIDQMMPDARARAGIGYVFHSELPLVVKKSDEMYHLGLLEKYERADDRRAKPQSWTFTQFIQDMSFPYWQQKGAVESIDQFWAMGELKNLLPTAGDNVFVYLSKDDPLNDPAEVAALQARFKPPFNVLPGGGHLGYAKSEWTKKTRWPASRWPPSSQLPMNPPEFQRFLRTSPRPASTTGRPATSGSTPGSKGWASIWARV